MMTKLNNEYEQLLKYLQQAEPKKKSPAKEQQEKKVEKASFDTKKFLEEAKVHSYIPEPNHSKDSKGFNVSRFENMMRTKLVEEYKKLQSYERPYISVTELYNCLRQSYYSRMRYPVNLNDKFRFAYLYLIQRVGNEIHDVIQNLYDFSETEKTVVSERYKVKGRVDGIRESFLYEIKSIDSNKFTGKYEPDHYIQAIIYAYILNSEYDYKIETVTIIYVLRNLKEVAAFDIKVDSKLAESFLNRALLLRSALDSIQVPEPIGATIDQCNYCSYRKACEEDKYKKVSQPFVKKQKAEEKTKKKEDDKKTAFLL